ncbi:MAG: GNAT family N-acetyltransferase, partial [Spirochaetia bacterium]|nr:GNAT family N-acetyltransferase [Spirochaetia bacterium]
MKDAFEIYLSLNNYTKNGNQKVSLTSLMEPLLKEKDNFIPIKQN